MGRLSFLQSLLFVVVRTNSYSHGFDVRLDADRHEDHNVPTQVDELEARSKLDGLVASFAASIERERIGAPSPPQTPLQREQAKLMEKAPVHVMLLPAKDADADVDTSQPIDLPTSYVHEVNEFARKNRLMQARFQRFSIHALHSARVIGERVRWQARKRERRPRASHRRGSAARGRARSPGRLADEGPLPPDLVVAGRSR